MSTMMYLESSYKKEEDPLVRIVKDLFDRVSVLEIRVKELEEEKNPSYVKLS